MYRLGSFVIAVSLFIAFVPGVVMTLPKHGKKWTVLLVHATLFALVTHAAMHMYHKYYENFGNHGPSCPSSHIMDDHTQTCHAKPQNSAGVQQYQ